MDYKRPLITLYSKLVLHYPRLTLVAVLMLLVLGATQAVKFRLDASADSLVLEHDHDLAYFRMINEQYGSNDFLVITYTPHQDLLSDDSLAGIEEMEKALVKLPRVESVISILDVPLLDSPRVSLAQISSGVRTLRDPDTDRELARKEFLHSPLYSNMLVSPDSKTTALQVNFKRDETYFSLLAQRKALRQKEEAGELSPAETIRLTETEQLFAAYTTQAAKLQKKDIEEVRAIIEGQRHRADLFLGGVPMITVDMINFIRSDIIIFGGAMLLFIVLALAAFFRATRWVALPLACCLATSLAILGLLGLLDWRATVISSNFLSLLLIITLSTCIHLTVRYRGFHASNPDWSQRQLVWATIEKMFKPCLFTILTTMVAFSSLVVSGIRPVIDFGWMMTIGLLVGFVLCFLLFPALLCLLKPGQPASEHDWTEALTLKLSELTGQHRYKIVGGALLVAIACGIGISKLEVENRFVDYFAEDTEIYQGMTLIDQKLGGTTPLDVIIDADAGFLEFLQNLPASDSDDPFADDFAEPDPFADVTGDGGSSDEDRPNYWFNGRKLALVEKIHDHLEEMPEIGKVQSIATTLKLVRDLNNGQTPDDIELALLRSLLPNDINQAMVAPYLSEDSNQVRLTMRVMETDPNLRRQDLIDRIHSYLIDDLKLAPEQVHLTGMLVLYNNMMQSLYESQILTIGAVMLAITLMFLLLFRSLPIAILTILPNLLAAGLVLGIMGWMGIPLDMMTITIAAIVVGIAVDDSIHYVHRFREEFAQDQNYLATMRRCHGSIGKAMYYTSMTIIVGFSILALSNFTPSIYFGLLTGLAMLVAMLCNLTLLPALFIIFKPLGRNSASA